MINRQSPISCSLYGVRNRHELAYSRYNCVRLCEGCYCLSIFCVYSCIFLVYIAHVSCTYIHEYGKHGVQYADSTCVSLLTASAAYALGRLFVIKFLARIMNWNAFDWPTLLCVEGQHLSTSELRYYVDVYLCLCLPLTSKATATLQSIKST